jgi:hypothetical protein
MEELPGVPGLPVPDKKEEQKKDTHPPSPEESATKLQKAPSLHDSGPEPPREALSREAIRFLADVAARPLSTTVSRYQRLHLSRRRGNAIRTQLLLAGVIRAVPLATRSGQVVLYELTEPGRSLCRSHDIDVSPLPRESLEHRYWAARAAQHFESRGYTVSREHPIKGNGAVDLLAERPGERVAIEVETGKSDIKANLEKVQKGGFDRIVLLATSPDASVACTRLIGDTAKGSSPVELLTWLDVS